MEASRAAKKAAGKSDDKKAGKADKADKSAKPAAPKVAFRQKVMEQVIQRATEYLNGQQA
jgi:hypothetical protein